MLPFYTTLRNSFSNGINLLKKGRYSVFWNELKKRVWSVNLSFGLRRDLRVNFDNPDARIEISIRPIKDGDFNLLRKTTDKSDANIKTLHDLCTILKANISTCYVAVNEHDDPCYMQWLIGAKQNDKIQQTYGKVFPLLKEDEALLEGAYTNSSFRGQRIMPAAMARIACKAEKLNARHVITFVEIHNIPALKGCWRSGFYPYILRKDRWVLFQRFISFVEIPKEMLEDFNEIICINHGVKNKIKKNEPHEMS